MSELAPYGGLHQTTPSGGGSWLLDRCWRRGVSGRPPRPAAVGIPARPTGDLV